MTLEKLGARSGKIRFYECAYYMFSNFSAFTVELDGIVYMTAEHAYQALKFSDPTIQELVRAASSAHRAKEIAHEHYAHLRSDWSDETKIALMRRIVRAKREQHHVVEDALIRSGSQLIIEDSPTDFFWGIGSVTHATPENGRSFPGRNELGKLWMEERRYVVTDIAA